MVQQLLRFVLFPLVLFSVFFVIGLLLTQSSSLFTVIVQEGKDNAKRVEETKTNTTLATPASSTGHAEVPIILDPCTLASDPATYNHKLIEVTGYISHSFENFSLVIPCKTDANIWIEYGGKRGSDTMMCCGIVPKTEYKEDLKVENITVSLVNDDVFHSFNKLLEKEYDTIIKATLVGRYFSGKKDTFPGGTFWTGFGHMGISSLLAIQQVKWFEPHDRTDIDYRDTIVGMDSDEKSNSWFNIETRWNEDDEFGKSLPAIAMAAEQSEFRNDPFETAKAYLAKTLKIDKSQINSLKLVRTVNGAKVYEWRLVRTRSYRVTVSRPYILLPFLKDPSNFPWIGTAVFNQADNEGETTLADIKKTIQPKSKITKKKKSPILKNK